MTNTFSSQLVIFQHIIDVNKVIMTSHSEQGFIRIILHYFRPFLCIKNTFLYWELFIYVTNHGLSIKKSYCNVFVLWTNCYSSCTKDGTLFTKSRSCSFVCCYFFFMINLNFSCVKQNVSLYKLMFINTPLHEKIIITCCVDMIIEDINPPYFSFIMTSK